MNRKRIKFISGICAMLVAANTFCMPLNLISPVKAEYTQAELEQQKLDNEKKIAELQKEIEEAKVKYAEVKADEDEKLEYQDILNEKINLQNENISVVVIQMNQIDDEIQETISDISDLEVQMKNQSQMIDANLELYKQRLRASYMTGSDTVSDVLSGSVSFFDILSKLEIVSKVARHDNDLVEELEQQLKKFKELGTELSLKQEELSENLADANERKSELDERLAVLQEDFNSTQEELDRILDRKYTIEENIEENEEIIALKESEQQKIDNKIQEIFERIRQESIAASVSVSESVSESQSVAESRRIEEENKQTVTQANPSDQSNPVTQSQVTQPPVTQPPVTKEPEPEVPETEYTQPAVDDSSLMFWPVPGFYRLSSKYGEWRGTKSHLAVDIQGHEGSNGYITIEGAKVYAADDGIVAATSTGCSHYGDPEDRCGGGFGNYVSLAHSDGVYSSIYAHLQSVYVSPGQRVKKGDFIGVVGNTGSSTGPHLHYALYKNGSAVNPHSVEYQNYDG